MTKLNKKETFIFTCVAALVIIAYICRIAGNISDNDFSRQLGILRSLIYIGLFITWGFSIKNRIMQSQARRYMMAIAALIVFWFLIRTLKYHFIPAETYPNLVRYIWYMYYLPMLFIPLLAVFVSMSIGKTEDYRLPKTRAFLYVPTSFLFLLVMTNDLHRLVFTFPADADLWTDNNNGYAIGYYLLMAWMFMCAGIMLVKLCRKSRMPGRRRLILLPAVPMALLAVYMVLYYTHVEWLRIILGDVTAVTCISYVVILELCINCGFIHANTRYMQLFDASTVGAQITDEGFNVLMSSATARPFDRSVLCQSEQGHVMSEDGIRLSSAPIQGGHVVWTEDMSPLLEVLAELEEVRENLKGTNDILEEENAVKAREAHIMENDRLYNIVQRDTAKQIVLMDRMIKQVERASSADEQIHLLKKMLVIGAYLKRRSNLVFLADKSSMLETKELDLTIGESMDNLEICGVVCGFRSELTGSILSVHLMTMYDFFETVTERSLDCMTTMMVNARKTQESFILTIDTDSSADLSDLASDTVEAVRDEDDEWRLVLRIERGGDSR